MITSEQVRHAAKLARLELTPEEALGYLRDFAGILALLDELPDEEGGFAGTEQSPAAGRLRADSAAPCATREQLLAAAPNMRDGYFVVPGVL